MEATSLDAGECRAPRVENDGLAEGKILFSGIHRETVLKCF